MPNYQDLVEEFIDGLSAEKFSGWRDKEYTICTSKDLGLRLDHQGLNKDKKTKPHRIFVQPLGYGKSKRSVRDSGAVLAIVHCDDDPDNVDDVREGLKESARTKPPKTVVV